jgi:diadenosine tetraphosphate (Ap4A) HIT family hydrolase
VDLHADCPLCSAPGGQLLWQDDRCRVIRAPQEEMPGFPAFYRVVWQAHVAEWSDLGAADQLHCMQVVNGVERAMRRHLAPTKVNLAALGNVVPHLHWHVVARYAWDSHFPAPVWAPAQRAPDPQRLQALAPALLACDAAIASGVFLA